MVFNLRNSIILFSLGTIILMGSLTIYSVTSIDINYFLRFLLINIFSVRLRYVSAGYRMHQNNLKILVHIDRGEMRR